MQKAPFRVSSLICGALAICALAAPARAQEPTSPPPTTPPPAGSPSGPVVAGGAIGVGAMASFAPDAPGADALLVYDQPMFHLDAALGYLHVSNPNNTSDSQFRFGLGGWYHLARGSMADFSLGGTVGIAYNSPAGPAGSSYTGFAIDPGAEARLFLSPNLALMGRVGFEIEFRDNNHGSDFGIGGSTVAAFGFTYFFR
ncbi:MAG TPA: hypothetical protein VHH90_09045 [Polyangia bacterium]|nr:hypothetical protein [Polyangia bacterium]